MDSLKENLTTVAVILCTFLGLLFVVSFIITIISRYECASYGEITGLKVKFAVATCYVNSGGKYIPYAEYRNKDVGNKIIVK